VLGDLTLSDAATMPASYLQERQFACSNDGISCATVQFAWRVRGSFDVSVLQQALHQLQARHETLRTSLAMSAEGIHQHIHPSAPTSAQYLDLRRGKAKSRSTLSRVAAEDLRRPFDLTRMPLYRLIVARMRDLEHLVLWTFHHAIYDGFSARVLLRDLAILYSSIAGRHRRGLRDLEIQFADYAAWERNVIDEEASRFWTSELVSRPDRLRIPVRVPSPATRGHVEEQHVVRAASPRVANHLAVLARETAATMPMVLVAGTSALLSGFAVDERLALGVTDANRDRPELEPLIGCLLNFLPIDVDLTGDPPFRELLARVRDATYAANAHKLPVGRLAALQRVHHTRRVTSLLYDVLVNFIPFNALAVPAHGLAMPVSIEPLFPPSQTLGYAARCNWSGWSDLCLVVIEDAEGALDGAFLYNRRILDRAQVSALAAGFARLLIRVSSEPDWRLSQLRRELSEPYLRLVRSAYV
jgi:hypothetical protein